MLTSWKWSEQHHIWEVDEMFLTYWVNSYWSCWLTTMKLISFSLIWSDLNWSADYPLKKKLQKQTPAVVVTERRINVYQLISSVVRRSDKHENVFYWSLIMKIGMKDKRFDNWFVQLQNLTNHTQKYSPLLFDQLDRCLISKRDQYLSWWLLILYWKQLNKKSVFRFMQEAFFIQ